MWAMPVRRQEWAVDRHWRRGDGQTVKATLWSVYILAGLLVGLGGWMFLARFASGTSTAGNLLELEAIAAVVIGGAALSGGRGKVFGAVVGTIIFAVIANLLSLLNVSTFLQDAFRGALILVADEDRTIPRVRLSTGVTLPYVAHGASSGTTVLLLHAWGESRRSFDRLLPLLPPELRVFAMDQRGHGEADKPLSGYLLQDFAHDIPAFMDEHGVSRAVLLGSSSGGYVRPAGSHLHAEARGWPRPRWGSPLAAGEAIVR